MHKVQAFYAEQMGAHGYGEVTFRVETDPQGQPLVHHVNGKHPFSHYDNTLGSEVFIELQAAFDFHANIYFIVLGTDALRQGDGQPAGGVGRHIWGKNGGMALVANDFSWDLVAHELGHAVGLGHDFRDGAYLMSYGPGQNRLSDCAAEFLSVHTYFNPDIPIDAGEPPTIELVSPRRYPAGSRSAPIRFQVNDSGGVHQVFLRGFSVLIECRGLEGDRSGLAEFEYNGYNGGFGLEGFTSLSDSTGHTIRVHAVDTEGNVSDTLFFSLAEESPHHIATLEAHTREVRSVSFSRDGTLASGSDDGTIMLWDIAARQRIATLEGHMNSVESVAFSPDGTLASGSGDGTIMLWDIAARQRIATLEGQWGWVYSVSFSPDGGSLARGDSKGAVKLWDVSTRQQITTLPHGGHVSSVSFSRDGMLLASGSEDRTVKLWDVATRGHIATLPHEIIVLSVTFSLDGGILASGGLGDIELWDVATESRIATLPHGANVSSVSFSPDGETLASGGWDGTVKLWDMKTRASFAAFGNTSPVYSVSFSPDGRTIASGTADGTIELWDTSGSMRERLEALAEIDIPDPNLRAAIATALGRPQSASIIRGAMATLTELNASDASISNLTGVEFATKLTSLELGDNNISNISVVAGLTNLTYLNLWGNNISDISVVAGLTNLTRLYLGDNNITDISPLVENTGLGSGHEVDIVGNPLSYSSIYTHIPVLQERGVEVFFDNRTPQRIRIVSGNDQQGLPGAALKKPFVVEVQDERGDAFEEVPITFTVTNGGGTLSVTSATTDVNGRAESILMLGPNPGANTVEVGVTGIHRTQSVSAIAELPPIPQDVNRDDMVNILDLVLVASVLGDEGGDLAADVNRAWGREHPGFGVGGGGVW